MPLRDLFGAPRDQPYADSDPRNPKNYYKVVNDKRLADEAAQDRRMSDAYANGKLKSFQPDSDGVSRQSAVEAGRHERKIPGVISHNDALYFVTESGWTHTERWRPSAEDEARRLRNQGHGKAVEAGGDEQGSDDGYGDRNTLGEREARQEQGVVGKGKGRKKSVGEKVKSFVFGAAGVTKE
jgi:hypothetical protein